MKKRYWYEVDVKEKITLEHIEHGIFFDKLPDAKNYCKEWMNKSEKVGECSIYKIESFDGEDICGDNQIWVIDCQRNKDGKIVLTKPIYL